MTPLHAEALERDPRVAEAKRLLLEAVAEHQKHLAVRPAAAPPADVDRRTAYDEMIRHFNEARGGNLYFPYLGSGLGHGPLVELADGSVKFDLISGIGVHHFGHSHPALISAAIDAALRDTVMQGNLQQNWESAELAAALLARVKEPDEQGHENPLVHCFLTTSGAMANENALKLAFHKKPGATRVLAFEHAFAGRTLALSTITDKAAYRVGLPPSLAVDYLPFFDATDPAGSIAKTRAVMRQHVTRYPNQHAAVWCELILGEGGFYPGSEAFFRAIAEEARAHKIAMVFDEVQTFGRTSRLFAFQHFGLGDCVDIVTVGKMLQVCATLFSDGYRPAPGIISQTFTGSTSAIFAARTILDALDAGGMFGPEGRNLRLHARFVERFEAIAARHPGWVRGPYGLGGMIAFTPFDGSDAVCKKLLFALFDAGVIAFYCGGGPTRLRFLPPVPVLTEDQVDAICSMLEAAMTQVAAAAGESGSQERKGGGG